MSDELMKKEDAPKPFKLGVNSNGLAARKKAAAESKALTNNPNEPTLPPAKMPDRIGIVMDDSGSMSGQPMKDAHEGIEQFLKNCKPTTTAVAVYPMNAAELKLCTTLPALAQLVKNIHASGGTPALETLRMMLSKESLTRAIMFTDGGYSNYSFNETVRECKDKNVPVDTVFIGPEIDFRAIEQLKQLAEMTGGVFMHFIPGKSNFATAFKYLSPGFRGLLMDEETRKKVERGEIK